VAALIGIAFFLDLREYSPKQLSCLSLIGLPVLMMVCVGYLVYNNLFARQSLTSSFWIVLVVTALGIVEPFWRGNLAFARVQQAMKEACRQYPHPFVISHSLGTYLTGHVLRETPELRLGRILFTGCVLDRRYLWKQIVPPQRRGLIAVTNYVGRRDLVPLATGCLRDLWVALTLVPFRCPWPGIAEFFGRLTTWRPLGMAGFRGFVTCRHLVHTQLPTAPCDACRREGQLAWVHNVDHGFACHSTLNKEKSFQSWSWLPCLWGMSADEFDEWATLCRLGHYYAQPALDALGQPVQPYQPQNPDGLSHCERELTQRLWSWPIVPEELSPIAGRALDRYVVDIVDTVPGAAVSAGLMKRLPKFVFNTVDEAWEKSQRTEDMNLETLERLHPQVALRYAVFQALRAEGQLSGP
jgi:hypothetical protein